MYFIDVITDGEASRETLVSALRWFLWDPRIYTVQRGVNLNEETKILRIKVRDADYADTLALRIMKDLVDSYSCFVHHSPDPWVPDGKSPFGSQEFSIQPI